MSPAASIQLKSDQAEVQFEWLDFDGDDCFNKFHISVSSAKGTKLFDFGPCVVWGLRKLSRFFRDPMQTATSSGFRHPDIRSYGMQRIQDGYRLIIRFEGSNMCKEFEAHSPSLLIEDSFLTLYGG